MPQERAILAATILGSSMVFLDGTVVSLALPRLQSELGASVIAVQWIVQAYALVLASLILLGGSLADRFGRRRMLVLGVSLFAISSVACGLSVSLVWLVSARCVQALGGALLAPSSLSILGASFDEKSRGRAIGSWSGWTTVTTAAGPPFGGWLLDHASWRWIFFINVPIAAATFGWRCATSPRAAIHASARSTSSERLSR